MNDEEGIVQVKITPLGFEATIWHPSCGCTDYGFFTNQTALDKWKFDKLKNHVCNKDQSEDTKIAHSMGIKL